MNKINHDFSDNSQQIKIKRTMSKDKEENIFDNQYIYALLDKQINAMKKKFV